MKLIGNPLLLYLTGLAIIASQFVSAHPRRNMMKTRRAASILNNPKGHPELPTAKQATAAAATFSLDLDNIQGDILVGMKKKMELFFFFSIIDVATFKSKLRPDIRTLITTTKQLLSVSTQPVTAVNIAFSQSGLNTLNIKDDLGDSAFSAGQFADAAALGDPGTSNWVSGFAGTNIHGVFLLASDTMDNVNSQLANIQSILNSSIVEVHRLQGAARPGDEEGHEHFGFMDGVSQPGVKGFTSNPTPGQVMVDPGLFLHGAPGDNTARPDWAKGGTFLAFRQLQQKVPEFNKFLNDNALSVPGLSHDQNAALLGARMVGRWKSGAPIDLAPLVDDPALGADPLRNNDFTFAHDGEDINSNQTRCPFSAHIRKTAPRADFNPVNTLNYIIRAGIPYGPEVTSDEQASGKTSTERGLAFVAYQSNLNNGFRFIQRTWANNPNFFFGKSDPTPGADPIIGALEGAPRPISGLDPLDPNRDITLLTDFVESRGGEYFFSPPLSAIGGILAV